MKKTLMLSMILFILLSTNANVLSKEQYNVYTLNSIKNLEKYEVVENPFERWRNTDSIKRRDVFDIICFVKYRGFSYELFDNDKIEDILIYNPMAYADFADVDKDTSDHSFVFVLHSQGILNGVYKDGKRYALLDKETTYYEALVLLCKLFINDGYNEEEKILENYPTEHSYFYYAKDLKIVNSIDPADLYCPQVTIEELDTQIPAYEFLSLLNRALYIPAISMGDYGSPAMYYYINTFVFNYEQKLIKQVKELEKQAESDMADTIQ